MDFFHLRSHDIAPNSVLLVSFFTILCESYLGIGPSIPLLRSLFHFKEQRETAGEFSSMQIHYLLAAP
jgi:hypothetical protein